MENDEFVQWMNYHKAAFPGLDRWIRGNGAQSKFWQRTLEGISLEDAKAATDALFESEDKPRGYSEHPVAIRRLAWNAREEQSYAGGQRVVDCQLCVVEDEDGRPYNCGVISVLSPKTLKALRSGDRSHGVKICAIACSCKHGERYANPPRGIKPLPRFSTAYSLISEQDWFNAGGTWDDAHALVKNLDDNKHVHPDFKDWS